MASGACLVKKETTRLDGVALSVLTLAKQVTRGPDGSSDLKFKVCETMKSKFASIVVKFVLICLSTLSVWAQGSSSGSGSQSTSSSATSASHGSATIENEIIAYNILETQAEQIAVRVATICKPSNSPQKCTNVLLTDPNEQSELITANGFEVSAQALEPAYDDVEPASVTAEALSDYLSAAGPLLTAIRSSAAYSNQTFQPTTQSMITFLTKALNAKGIALWASTALGNLKAGLDNVKNALGAITKKRNDAYGRAQKDPDDKKKTAAITALGEIDKEFSSFRTSLTAASPDGTILATIVKRETLQESLGATGLLLTVSVDAAGGDTKVTHFFWQELFWPTPSPSYNGGTVVSFLLAGQNGTYLDADLFHVVTDFSKWKGPKYVNHDH